MKQHVLVLGDDTVVRDALEFLLLSRVTVRHAHAASDAEGIGVDVVVVSDPGLAEHVRDVLVHPHMSAAPVVALTASPGGLHGFPHVHIVDTRTPDVLDQLTEHVSRLLARATHPAYMAALDRAGAA